MRERRAGEFSLSAGLACKLGSIVVHAEEAISADGHPFDIEAIKTLLRDAEVQAWLTKMRDLALVPLARRKL